MGVLSTWIYLFCFQYLRGIDFAANKVFGSSRAPIFFVVARLRAKAANYCLHNAMQHFVVLDSVVDLT